MLSTMGLEVMNSTNSDLNWNTVTKGRRSKKLVGRSLKSIAKVGNSYSPKRVGDFSGSDSDKFGGAVIGQSTSGTLENVPVKKRRNLTKSSSSTPLPNDEEELPYSSYSSGKRLSSSYSNSQLRGNDCSAEVRVGKRKVFIFDRTESKYNCAGDFSGIELLAAAAIMDADADNASKEDLVAEDLSLPTNSDVSTFAARSKLCLECNESEKSSSNMRVHGANTDRSLIMNDSAAAAIQQLDEFTEDEVMPKVNRQHWDLNIPMDAWGEPCDDSIAGNNSMDVMDNNMHMEKRQNNILIPGCTGSKSSNPKLEENKLTAILLDRTCVESPALEDCFHGPPNNSYSDASREPSDRATDVHDDDWNSNQVLRGDAHMEVSTHVMNEEAINTSSNKFLLPSSMLMSDEKLNTVSITAATIQDEDCSSSVSESKHVTASNQIQTKTEKVTVDDMTDTVVSECATDVKHKDAKDSRRTSELSGDMIALKETINAVPCEGLDADNSRSNSDDVNYSPSAAGTYIEVDKSVLVADSKNQNDGTFVTDSTIVECRGQSQPAELLPKDEDSNLPNEESKTIIMETSCKSDDPTNSVGKTGSTTNDRHDFGVSQHNHAHLINGDYLTRFQEEGYDSPFEDGELRGSFLYPWEENELEECVDYESDGRNGDGSEIIEDVSEGSHSTAQRNLLVNRFPQGSESKSGSIKHSSRSCFNKGHSNDNEIAGKGESNAGSGTTVEQSMEMVINENGTKRRNLTSVVSVDSKVAVMDDYGSKTTGGKLQSRIGGSCMDATDGKDVFFKQQCRSRRLGDSYSRPEKDVCPDKYVGRFRPATNNSKRDGTDQWTYLGPKYVGPEGHSHTRPRHISGDSPDKYGGMDYHKPRQNSNYMSKGFHKPFVRRSPMERDDSVGVRRRMPLTRGGSSYRSRGHYSQRSGRDFGDDFDSRPDEFFPKRERNFSPNSGRGSHIPLPRRSRSRSRTRSPRAWGPHRERDPGSIRFSRSPDFRPEGRMDRIRAPFSKPNFASDFGEGYDRNFGENHVRRRRSPPPNRVFKRTQNSDENFRPTFRPGRFSFMGRESKFEPNYDVKRHDDKDEMMVRRPHSGDGGNFRRLRCNNDFPTSSSLNSKSNNEDDNVRGTDPREVNCSHVDGRWYR